MNTKSIIISLLHLSIISSQIDSIEKHFGGNIISMYGPPGGEVTSFLNDSYGNYWIGTGSSGGIYLSNDKGNNWKPVNKNIGVSHIFEIIEKDNEIFTYLVPNDSLGLLMDEERFWGSTVKDLAKWYKYNSSDSSWNVISLSSFEYKIFNAELKRLKTMIKTEKESNYSIFNEYLNPIKKCIDKVGNYSLGFEIDHMPFPKNSIGFDVVDGEIISINPNGIYHLKNISKVKDLEYKNNTLLDILDNEKEKLKNKIIKYENYLFEPVVHIK